MKILADVCEADVISALYQALTTKSTFFPPLTLQHANLLRACARIIEQMVEMEETKPWHIVEGEEE